MRVLYVQDQRDRGVRMADDGSTEHAREPRDVSTQDQIKCDAQRQQTVRAMLGRGAVKSAQDFHDASFIFQHGQVPDDYLLAHILAIEAVALGDASSRWIAAATLDRYLQSIGQKQVFGTQYGGEQYLFYMQHRSEPDVVKKMQAVPDLLTQEPNNRSLVPAMVRQSFCVPTTEVQQAYVDAVRSGKKADIPRLADCQR